MGSCSSCGSCGGREQDLPYVGVLPLYREIRRNAIPAITGDALLCARVLCARIDSSDCNVCFRYIVDNTKTDHIVLHRYLCTILPSDIAKIIVQYQCLNVHEHLEQIYKGIQQVGIRFTVTGYDLDFTRLDPIFLSPAERQRRPQTAFVITSTTQSGLNDSSYLKVHDDEFVDAYQHLYRFHWQHRKKSSHIGVCVLTALLHGSSVKLSLKTNRSSRRYQRVAFFPQ
jgi:hypothetical protein